MKCALIRWWLEEYSDGVLKGWRLRWVEKHLRECRACAQELAAHRELRDALASAVFSTPPQDMWQDFQRRLAERVQPTPTPRAGWWQLGTATAAVACALALGMAWWKGHAPVSETSSSIRQPDTQQVTSRVPQLAVPAMGEAQTFASSPPPKRSPTREPVHTTPARPVRRAEGSPSPVREVKRTLAGQMPEKTFPAPVQVVSMAYAEVRNAQGELVGKVLVQTTYDENGQPKTVQIECNTPVAAEVESNGQPVDGSDSDSDTGSSAGSPTPSAGTRPGLSD